MHFHGAYFSNLSSWQLNPNHCLPSAHTIWYLIGQDILNLDTGGYFQGQYITSGVFNLWRSEGLINQIHLKYSTSVSLLMTLISLVGAYFHFHISYFSVHFNKSLNLYPYIIFIYY